MINPLNNSPQIVASGSFLLGNTELPSGSYLIGQGYAVRNPAVPDTLYAQLQTQCAQRAPLFSAQAEKTSLLQLVQVLTTPPN